MQVGDLGELFYDKVEPDSDVVTWVYEEGSFTPIAKLADGERFSIVSDYLGTPVQAFDASGELVWERELNIYGGIRKETGAANFVAMRYQGQYFDEETGLCYNRHRYYDPGSGLYLSQDPIGLAGGTALYGYVHDTNAWVDVEGLQCAKAAKGGSEILKTTTRVGKNGNAAEILFKNGNKMDINAARVKEWVPNLHPNAPIGTLQKVKFPNSILGSKGFKRTPTQGEIDFLNSLFR